MAWTPPPSYTNGQIITQTDLHVGLRDNMRELFHPVAYVEFASTVSSSSASYVDVVSAGAVTYRGFPIIIEFFTPKLLVAATGGCSVFQDGAVLSLLGFDGVICTGGQKYYTPTAASHTFKVAVAGTGGGGTSSAYGAAGSPGFIRVWEKGAA